MKTSLTSKHNQNYNYYLHETKRGKLYYQAIPKNKERKKLLWLFLTSIAILTTIIASNFSLDNTYDDVAHAISEEETTEVVVEVIPNEEVKVYEGVCSEWYELVSQYDWNIEEALAIMKAESNCQANAFNGTINYDGSWDAGLFQVNSIHGKEKDWLMIPENNVQEAYNVYLRAGRSWTPWSVYNNGRYLNFLAQ